MVFRTGGHLTVREKWFSSNGVVKLTNAYNVMGMIFTTKFSLNAVLSERCRKGKEGVIESQKSMRKIKHNCPCLF